MKDSGHIYFHRHSTTFLINGTKIEEERGDTFTWKTLKENFIKDFSFNPHEDQLKEATKHIKEFV